MKDREATIQFEMQYCQHYKRGKGADMVCAKGMDLNAIQNVEVGTRKIKWGPCIEGHTLENPKNYCVHWIRRTREMGEKRSESIERSIAMLTKAEPFISAWRKKEPFGKSEIVACPVCGGRLHLSQVRYNGHVHASCETKDCVRFME